MVSLCCLRLLLHVQLHLLLPYQPSPLCSYLFYVLPHLHLCARFHRVLFPLHSPLIAACIAGLCFVLVRVWCLSVRLFACVPRDDTVTRRQLQDALQEFDFLCDMESYPNTLRRPQQHRSLELSDAIMPLQESPQVYPEPELIRIPHKHSPSSSQSQRQSSSNSSSEQFSLPIRNPFQFQPVPVTTSPRLGVKEAPPASAVNQQLHRPVLTLPPVVLLGGRRAEEDESVPASPLVEYPEDDDEYLYSGGGGVGLQPSHSHHSNNSSSAGFCVEVRRFFHLNPFLIWLWFGYGYISVTVYVLFCFDNLSFCYYCLLFCYCPSYRYC